MTLEEVKQIVAEKHGYPNYLSGIFERNKPTCRYTVTELVNEVAELYAEIKVKNISSKPMLADRLPNAEDVKRWHQLLVGKGEDVMQKDIEATLR